MQTKDLIVHYQDSPLITQLSASLQQRPKEPWKLQGVTGSLDALLITALYHRCKQTQIVVLENQEEALAVWGDCSHLLPDQSILFLPGLDASNKAKDLAIMQHKRVKVMHAIAQKSAAVVVTDMAALLAAVIDPSSLHSFEIALAQSLSLDALEAKLKQQQFTKVAFVYHPGQFAIRGGIIDIYTITEAFPYRIELWGREVAGIRIFNPKDQRSFEQRNRVTILSNPVSSLKYTAFTTYLPSGSCIWVKEQAFAQLSTGDSISEANFLSTIASFHQIRFNSESTPPQPSDAWIINYNSEKQPNFKQNFNLLAADIAQKNQQHYQVCIASLTPGQCARLDTILKEKDPTTDFSPLLMGLRAGYIDHTNKIVCYTDHQIFNRHYRQQASPTSAPRETLLMDQLSRLHTGDYVVHSDYGIGRFAGLHTLHANGHKQEAVRLVYKNNDAIYVNVHELHKIHKYTSKDGTMPTIHTLGSASWKNKKQTIKKQIKDIAKDLITLYAKRKNTPGFAFEKDCALDAALAASFAYEETPDQAIAITAVKADMEQPTPMDRLICGDVGFGKTEIAMRTAFKAAIQGKQVAILVPTTILVLQHYNSFVHRLATFPVRVSYLNRFKTQQEIQQTIADTASGKIHILIGTHQLLHNRIKFKDLGLLIIDEEQKFGVSAKEKLRQVHHKVDTLTLTATPIPRTLHLSLMGARDLSILTTPPVNRRPIQTKLYHFDLNIIKEAIQNEINRNGQVFFIHNHIGSIHTIATELAHLLPTARIEVVHGQMSGSKLETKILRFMSGYYDVLLSTRIIESGMDIPNANTIIINDSHLLGLADLHQMRGRVGRSNLQSFCYLFIPNDSQLTPEAKLRLTALEEFSALGDGFKLAMRDLDIRGAGDFLGAAQSGFMADIGFDTYCKILEEAVAEVKHNDFKTLFNKDPGEIPRNECTVETDLESLLPSDYVQSPDQRIALYKRLNEIQHIAQLTALKEALIDQFGPLPEATLTLLETVPLRWEAQRIGFQKISLKAQTLRCYLGADFQKKDHKMWEYMVHYIQSHATLCQLKQVEQNLVLTITAPMPTIAAAKDFLGSLTHPQAESYHQEIFSFKTK